MREFQKRSTAVQYCWDHCYDDQTEPNGFKNNAPTRFRIEIIATDLRKWKTWFTRAARFEVAKVDGMITPICDWKALRYSFVAGTPLDAWAWLHMVVLFGDD